MTNKIRIYAKDCCRFNSDDESKIDDAIKYLLKFQDNISLLFTENKDDPIAEFDYKSCCWRAGRYIGQITFELDGEMYEVTILPRFGDAQFFSMLEEIYNVRIIDSMHGYSSGDYNNILKKIISFIWIQKIAQANQHGLPKRNTKKENIGYDVKGRINIRKSIPYYFRYGQVLSIYNEKCLDDKILKILGKAYYILSNKYGLHKSQVMPDNALDLLNHFEDSSHYRKASITENEYSKINYKSIYLRYKDAVDFSWQVIKNDVDIGQNQMKKEYFSFFIDIAEIWEKYIFSILKKHFQIQGWKTYCKEYLVYPGTFYSRKIIPDIIMEKDDNLVIWDAKYKMMEFRNYDVDRGDFYQIHSYHSILNKKKHVLGGGLIYPFSSNFNEFGIDSIIAENEVIKENNSFFCINGIDYSKLEDVSFEERKEFIRNIENDFKSRVSNLINI